MNEKVAHSGRAQWQCPVCIVCVLLLRLHDRSIKAGVMRSLLVRRVITLSRSDQSSRSNNKSERCVARGRMLSRIHISTEIRNTSYTSSTTVAYNTGARVHTSNVGQAPSTEMVWLLFIDAEDALTWHRCYAERHVICLA